MQNSIYDNFVISIYTQAVLIQKVIKVYWSHILTTKLKLSVLNSYAMASFFFFA